jgi:hypothetical protein
VTEIQRVDEYEEPALVWFFREATRLNDILTSAGVADESARREICTNFFFGMGYGLGEPVESSGSEYRVVVGLETADNRVLLPTEMFDFHDYAHGVVGQVYGDD